MMDLTLLSEAIRWVEIGVAVIPIKPRSKVAAVRWLDYQGRLPTAEELYGWFVNPAAAPNLGIVTGWGGIVVIDFDSLDAYFSWRALYPDVITYEVITGRGVHVYLFVDEPVKPCKIPGVGDVKAAGGYVLGVPSIHPSGAVYSTLNDAPILRLRCLAEILPAELLAGAQPTQSAGKAALDLDTIRAAQSEDLKSVIDPWAALQGLDSLDLVTKIRAKINILSFFPNAIKTGDRWYMARCPFHDDHNPSMWINERRGVCGCHACGGRPMDVINLMARLRGISNKEAIDKLAARIRSE